MDLGSVSRNEVLFPFEWLGWLACTYFLGWDHGRKVATGTSAGLEIGRLRYEEAGRMETGKVTFYRSDTDTCAASLQDGNSESRHGQSLSPLVSEQGFFLWLWFGFLLWSQEALNHEAWRTIMRIVVSRVEVIPRSIPDWIEEGERNGLGDTEMGVML